MKTEAEKLMNFIDASPSMFHAAENVANYLRQCGFTELDESEAFEMEAHGKYFINKDSCAVIAWQNGAEADSAFHIIGSHLDSPSFKIKPNPEMNVLDCYTKLNTEMYGGAIISSWFDRPLSVAGQIFVAGETPYKPRQILIDIAKPVLVIPNLAIHMNREINDGYKYNKQKDTLPLFSLINKPNSSKKDVNKNAFMEMIAEHANVKREEILSADLFLYNCEASTFIGNNNELFLAGKIDNLGMAFASLEALTKAKPSECGKMICLFNNEEVGSSTAAGAGSPFFADTLKRIAMSYARKVTKDKTRKMSGFELFQTIRANSFLISADQAHAAHPNYLEKNDVTNFPLINGGPAVKTSAAMSYTSEAPSIAIFKKLCLDANVPCQDFVNRSDMRGGSTIGPIAMQNLNIKSVDVGNPILAMHSVKELGGTFDQDAICKVFRQFFL